MHSVRLQTGPGGNTDALQKGAKGRGCPDAQQVRTEGVCRAVRIGPGGSTAVQQAESRML